VTRIAEFIAQLSPVELARPFYRPILKLGPAGRYWVEDFLQAWITIGLEITADVVMFTKIWQDMVQYAMTLPAWQPGKNRYWARAESLAVDLVGLHEAAVKVLGQAKYTSVVTAMAVVFERWAAQWLKYASVASWYAHFLVTESGQVLLRSGLHQLAGVVGSFEDSDWHRYGLGALFSETLSACWKSQREEVESEPSLRKGFLAILTELCARQIPEALHLRSKVSEFLQAG